MNNIYKKTIIGFGCVLFSACSTLSEYGIPGLDSFKDGLPSTDGITDLDTSRLESVKGLAKAATLSNEEVIAYAKSYSKFQDQSNKVAPANNPYSIRLNKLVKNHIKEDGLNLNFKVYLDPQVNAFAMADGTVRVYSGLMDLMKDDEILSVIGHEIGHVKHEHTKAQIQKAYVANSLLSAGSSELQAKMGGTLGGEVSKMGVAKAEGVIKALAEAQFSQSDEEQADDYGLKFLNKHNYKNDAGIRALRKLATLESGDQSTISGLFSSHPASEDRALRLEEELGVKTEKTEEHKEAKADEVSEIKADETSEITSDNNPIQAAAVNNINTIETSSVTWFIQVAAEHDKETAEKTLKNFLDKGHDGAIQKAMVNGTLYFRVLVGPFANSKAAKSKMSLIESYGFSNGQPFLKKSE